MSTRRRLLLGCAAAAPAPLAAPAAAFRSEPMRRADAAAYSDGAACPAPAAHAALREEVVGALAAVPPARRGAAALRLPAVCSFCLRGVAPGPPPQVPDDPG